MRNIPALTVLTAVVVLSGCVSESTYVANDRQVNQRTVDNTEAAKTRISLGLNYLRRGETTQALFNLERARAMAPSLPDVYNALAYYYQTVGENTQAENSYKQAIAIDRNNADAYNNYGAFLCQIGKYEEAESLLLSAIQMPGYIRVAESYENIALCQLEQNRFSQAKASLASSKQHNPSRLSVLINSAALNYAMGNLAEAKTELQRMQTMGRMDARTTLLGYLVSSKQGDAAATTFFEQSLLNMYRSSAETRLFMNNNLQQSEFEVLRKRYEDTMYSQLRTSQPQAEVPAQRSSFLVRNTNSLFSSSSSEPVAQPQVRVTAKRDETSLNAPVTQQTPSRSADAVRVTATEAAVATAATLNATSPRVPAATAPTVQAVATANTAAPHASTALQSTEAASVATLSATAPRISSVTESSVVTGSASTPRTMTAAQSTVQVATASVQAASALTTATAGSVVQPAAEIDAAYTRVQSKQAAAAVKQNTPDYLSDTALLELVENNLHTISSSSRTIASRQDSAIASRSDLLSHTVEASDTMFSIAMQYGLRLERFMQWNNLTEKSRLEVGQKLLVEDPAK